MKHNFTREYCFMTAEIQVLLEILLNKEFFTEGQKLTLALTLRRKLKRREICLKMKLFGN